MVALPLLGAGGTEAGIEVSTPLIEASTARAAGVALR